MRQGASASAWGPGCRRVLASRGHKGRVEDLLVENLLRSVPPGNHSTLTQQGKASVAAAAATYLWSSRKATPTARARLLRCGCLCLFGAHTAAQHSTAQHSGGCCCCCCCGGATGVEGGGAKQWQSGSHHLWVAGYGARRRRVVVVPRGHGDFEPQRKSLRRRLPRARLHCFDCGVLMAKRSGLDGGSMSMRQGRRARLGGRVEPQTIRSPLAMGPAALSRQGSLGVVRRRKAERDGTCSRDGRCKRLKIWGKTRLAMVTGDGGVGRSRVKVKVDLSTGGGRETRRGCWRGGSILVVWCDCDAWEAWGNSCSCGLLVVIW